MRAIFIPFLLLHVSCSGQKSNSSGNYYFPPGSFLNEKIYCFVNSIDTAEKTYWKMKTVLSNNDTLFQTVIINGNKVTEEMVEIISNGNSQILTFKLYNSDRSTNCTIIDSVVYKSNQNTGENIQWKVAFRDFNSPNTISLTKTRILESIDDKYQTFLDKMSMNVVGSNTYDYTVKSIYEKGKGLISYEIIRPNGQKKLFELNEIR